jgi:hypothetical protein
MKLTRKALMMNESHYHVGLQEIMQQAKFVSVRGLGNTYVCEPSRLSRSPDNSPPDGVDVIGI